jgi:CMP-N-acetylneuraminic acid synthetase
MVRVAIIPARGGSKRLPGKNVRSFFGHPMLAYAIAAAENTRLFGEIIVSSDDPEIGRIAKWYGARYLERPALLATDEASLVDVALHMLNVLISEGKRPGELCQLMPNCPLRTSKDIVDLHQDFETNARDFQISAIPYRGVYPHWAMVVDERGLGRWAFGQEFLVQSQNLSRTYCPTGATWWVRTEPFQREKSFYGPGFCVAPMPPNEGIDIDTEEDLHLAELLVKGQLYDGKNPLEPIRQVAFAG